MFARLALYFHAVICEVAFFKLQSSPIRHVESIKVIIKALSRSVRVASMVFLSCVGSKYLRSLCGILGGVTLSLGLARS